MEAINHRSAAIEDQDRRERHAALKELIDTLNTLAVETREMMAVSKEWVRLQQETVGSLRAILEELRRNRVASPDQPKPKPLPIIAIVGLDTQQYDAIRLEVEPRCQLCRFDQESFRSSIPHCDWLIFAEGGMCKRPHCHFSSLVKDRIVHMRGSGPAEITSAINSLVQGITPNEIASN
jgi:hypothetical protein